MAYAHSVAEIRDRLAEGVRPSYLRDWVLGALDGSVSTFAAVSGVVAVGLAAEFVLIVGAANIIADGFSMAAANYSGTRSEGERVERLRAVEERHIQSFPEGEMREVREIYRGKGFEGADLDRAVEIVTADRETWIDTMLVEEYGASLSQRSPLRAAGGTFVAFLLCGLVPLLPFTLAPWMLDRADAFTLSLLVTAAAFFCIGSAKSRWSLRVWWRSGFETLALGLCAAGLAYAIGLGLKSML